MQSQPPQLLAGWQGSTPLQCRKTCKCCKTGKHTIKHGCSRSLASIWGTARQCITCDLAFLVLFYCLTVLLRSQIVTTVYRAQHQHVLRAHLCVAAALSALHQTRRLARQQGAQTAGQAVHCSCWSLPSAAPAGKTCKPVYVCWQYGWCVALTIAAPLLAAAAAHAADVERQQCCWCWQ
jgi:hypothetical protein